MNAREVITEELRHMGSFIPHVEAGNIIYRLRIAGFVIIPRSEVEAIRTALEEAKENIAHWGSYASKYFQEKHGLEADIASVEAAIRKLKSEAASRDE